MKIASCIVILASTQPTTQSPSQSTIVGADWLVILQELSTPILVVITAIYVVFTWRMLKHSYNVHEDDRRSREAEKKDRRNMAWHAVRIEVQEIVNACQVDDKNLEVTIFTTDSWDTMKGELLPIDNGILARLLRMYQLARQCNAYYAGLTTTPNLRGEPRNIWQRRVGVLRPVAAAALNDFSGDGLLARS